ncbi:iron-sulfur cluster-binding domain-containing protein [Acinetobacter sp. MD2(2019)]|uniref:flavin reductase family protein n=1 Tax=Acinetobacter sp. MD2(2019) TaxID=2605273 RepID=UPI002D1F0743|nr:iron-sulfur cluster-binding domain-containing protein [Acinetobacter sp. MD2(2019)]MEB3753402.1 iron-sulfur cluster-binding domain-containing protein [Acinetobacter sp. MD2(2019)]
MHIIQRKNPWVDFFSNSIMDRRAINFWLKKANPLWSTDQMLGRIVKKECIADDTYSLTIQCNRQMKYGLAGQHHPVMVEIEGRRYERTYSLTQLDSQHVLLTVKKVEQGLVSSWLCEQAQIGDVIEFGQPYGDMQVSASSDALILLAAGSGITPMFSLLSFLEQTNQLKNYQIHLMYWAQHATGLAFKNTFEAWQKKYPNFQFSAFCTRDEPAAQRLNEQHVEGLGQLNETRVLACGPSGFVNRAESLFTHAKQFEAEAFSLSPISFQDEGVVNITLAQSNKVISVAKGQPLLDALEQANLKPEFGCRMGICNKCACTKVSGVTKHVGNGAENAEPANLIRICVNSAKSDLVLDL